MNQSLELFPEKEIKVNVFLVDGKPTVTSRVIAEQLSREHRNVVRDIRRILDEQEYEPIFFTDSMNRRQVEYLLNKDSFFLLVMNYEGHNDFKRAYITRFNEMESELIKNNVPKSYGEALIEAGRLAIENEKLLIENKENKPKVEFYNRVTDTTDTIDMANVSQLLNIKNIGRNKLYGILRKKKVLRESPEQSKNTPYQEYINRGYFKIIEVETGGGIKLKTLVYQKGLDYIRKILDKNS